MQISKLLSFLIFCFLFSINHPLHAQTGWEIIYPSPNAPNGDGIDALRQTPDGGYILVGVTAQNSAAGRSRIVKVDDHGITQWAKTYNLTGNMSWAYDVEITNGGYLVYGRLRNAQFKYASYLQKLDVHGNQVWYKEFTDNTIPIDGELTSDGGHISVGYYDNNSIQDTLVFIKTDSIGDTEWVKKYPNAGIGIERLPISIDQTSTGNYITYGRNTDAKAFLWMLDSQGDSTWQKTYGNNVSHPEYIGKVKETSDGGFVVASNDALATGETDLYLFKTDVTGLLQWEHRYGIAGSMDELATDLDLTADGGFIVSGNRVVGITGNSPILLMKIDGLGNLQWERGFAGDQTQNWKSYSVQQTADGGFAIGGAHISNSYSRENMYLIKTDSLGYIYNNIIQGYVYDDFDSNCTPSSTERKFKGWTVKADGAKTFFASTDSNGYYMMRVDTGSYELVLSRPSPNLYEQSNSCGNDSIQLNIPTYGTTTDTSFAQYALAYCPLLEVTLATPLLRRCFTSNYYVQYCNNGTLDAPSAYIDVEFDPYLIVDTAGISMPWTMIDSVSYRFNIGTVAVAECNSFTVPVTVDCDSTVLGQTHCSEAHIYPDSSCLAAPWSGPFINVEADCEGDSVVFYLSNSGSNMAGVAQYIVYEDNVLVRPGSFILNNSEVQEVRILATAKKTYRIEAQQAIGIPEILSDSLVTVAIEGCQDSINPGFVIQFPNFDGSPFVDMDCIENIGSFDPNDKRGFPKGYGAQHYIYPTTDLDYHIRFQNTGTDTAFFVVIRDTISPFLDINTLHPTTSSHAYTWRVFGETDQIVEFSFLNIMLVDSNANEPASHGFIRFSIQQKTNNPLGSIIENSAAIYFDFNAPVITNTTTHQVGDNFVQVNIITDNPTLNSKKIQTKIYPNPFSSVATIEIEGYNSTKAITFYLYDAMGRQVSQIKSNSNQFQLQRNQLVQGLYYYRIEGDDKVIDSGKIIVTD
ncbi:MAG: T9SS type A sorting domain-containing protein [Aureispira sp.]|nr:T9SS type A sorting domain-containing protein [Aureispira sp.]